MICITDPHSKYLLERIKRCTGSSKPMVKRSKTTPNEAKGSKSSLFKNGMEIKLPKKRPNKIKTIILGFLIFLKINDPKRAEKNTKDKGNVHCDQFGIGSLYRKNGESS